MGPTRKISFAVLKDASEWNESRRVTFWTRAKSEAGHLMKSFKLSP